MPSWTAVGSGNWNDVANWSAGGVPNAAGSAANFSNATNGGTVQVGIVENTTMTVGLLNVSLVGTTGLTIGGATNDTGTGSGTLRFNNNTGFANMTIDTNVGGGEFEISGAGGLRVDLGTIGVIANVVNAGTTARINAEVFGAGDLQKNGDGRLVLGGINSSWTGEMFVFGGILQGTGVSLGSGHIWLAGGTLRTGGTVVNDISVGPSTGAIAVAPAGIATLTGYFSNQSGGTAIFGSATDTGTIIANFNTVGTFGDSGTSIAGGTLRLENAAVARDLLSTPGAGLTQIASGATLDTRGFTTNISNLDFNGGTIRATTGALDLDIDYSVTGTISQSGTLIGTAGLDRISVFTNGGFSFAGVAFSGWTSGTDLITLTGGTGDNVLGGSPYRDTIFGREGDDTIFGNGGDDYIYGGEGNDLIVLSTSGSGARVFGDLGNDTLRIDSGAVDLGTMGGIETIQFTGGGSLRAWDYDMVGVSSLAGTGTLIVDMFLPGTFSGGQFAVQAGSTIAATINGNNDAATGDFIIGIGGASNTIYGNGGADQIRGANLRDTIYGGDGDDKINGRAGSDIMYGGAGADTFRYGAAANSGLGVNADHIMDFLAGTDKLSFVNLDADPVAPGQQGLTYVGTSLFANNGVAQIRWQGSGADIRVDVDLDGNGVADMQIFLDGAAGQTLTSGDFLL